MVVGAGAKVLGPITIGDDARIGSNAVVLHDAPPGSTVIGVPGRVIKGGRTEQEGRREAMAKKLGFDAYGATKDAPDPLVHAINSILDHLHGVDDRLEALSGMLKQAEGMKDVELPHLEPCKIKPLDEDGPAV